jgi:hypothetical protein
MTPSIKDATYEGDFYAWLLKSAELLRQKQFAELDGDRWKIIASCRGATFSHDRPSSCNTSLPNATPLRWWVTDYSATAS